MPISDLTPFAWHPPRPAARQCLWLSARSVLPAWFTGCGTSCARLESCNRAAADRRRTSAQSGYLPATCALVAHIRALRRGAALLSESLTLTPCSGGAADKLRYCIKVARLQRCHLQPLAQPGTKHETVAKATTAQRTAGQFYTRTSRPVARALISAVRVHWMSTAANMKRILPREVLRSCETNNQQRPMTLQVCVAEALWKWMDFHKQREGLAGLEPMAAVKHIPSRFLARHGQAVRDSAQAHF